jgi:5-hydroxyisourate hydrolase-like protein (transthyretin family)
MMNLRKLSIVALSIAALGLAACNPPSGPTTPGSSNAPTTTEKASMSGKVVKEDGSPAKNATVVLIQKESGADKDAAIKRTNDAGEYTFEAVAKGEYRVAFVIQTEKERQDKTPIAYDPAQKSGEFFGAITTNSFSYDGDKTKTFQVPSFNVGWMSNLSPNKAEVEAGKDVKFTWSTLKDANVKGYNVVVKNDEDNVVYRSAEVTEGNLVWNGKMTDGKMIEKGKSYLYIVNAVFKKPESADVYPTAGNTANATFSVK